MYLTCVYKHQDELALIQILYNTMQGCITTLLRRFLLIYRKRDRQWHYIIDAKNKNYTSQSQHQKQVK